MSQNLSLTRKTVPQRKATVLRRVLGTLAFVGLLAVSQTADAQSRSQRGDGARGGDRTEQQIQQLTTDLDLSSAQAVQIRSLFEAQKASRPARGERGTSQRSTSERGRGDRQAHRAEMDRQIEALLTPAQVERFQAVKASRQQRGQRGQRGGTR